MKKLLVFDRKRNNREQLVDMLQMHKPAVRIEEAGSISEVLKKLTFEKKTCRAKPRQSADCRAECT